MSILLLLIAIFGVGFALLFVIADRQTILAHWDEKRCSLPVLFTAGFYKPTSDKRSAAEFSVENFTFCSSRIAQDVIKAAMAPFVSVLGSQIGNMGSLQEVLNSVRGMLGTFQRGFTDLLDGAFRRFQTAGFEIRRIYARFFEAMSRAAAIAVDTVFLGLSMVVGIENTYRFIAKVVMIVMGILVALLILLFFILFPVMPLIMTTISVLVAAGFGEAAGMAGAFCFPPETLIPLQTGNSVRIDAIQLGDVLANGATVEGILHTQGTGVQMYIVGKGENAIHVSGDHLILSEYEVWISVRGHPDAKPIEKQEPVLYCLNTSTHTIPIGKYLFADWEEIPDKYTHEWNEMIGERLNGYGGKRHADPLATHYPILSGAWTLVRPDGNGTVTLRDVEVGETILSFNDIPTRVLGKYRGREKVYTAGNPHWVTNSVWNSNSQIQRWEQGGLYTKGVADHYSVGFHLITESGTFQIGNESRQCVRDFTEIGIRTLPITSSWVKKKLNSL